MPRRPRMVKPVLPVTPPLIPSMQAVNVQKMYPHAERMMNAAILYSSANGFNPSSTLSMLLGAGIMHEMQFAPVPTLLMLQDEVMERLIKGLEALIHLAIVEPSHMPDATLAQLEATVL